MSKQHDPSAPDRRLEEDYEVGYRKPPAAFRFKKGASGNPKGRPPGRRTSESPEAGTKKTARGSQSAGVSDQELLRMVKARKLTWQALFDLYVGERRVEAEKAKVSKRGRA
jgi:hypothetical protein